MSPKNVLTPIFFVFLFKFEIKQQKRNLKYERILEQNFGYDARWGQINLASAAHLLNRKKPTDEIPHEKEELRSLQSKRKKWKK